MLATTEIPSALDEWKSTLMGRRICAALSAALLLAPGPSTACPRLGLVHR